MFLLLAGIIVDKRKRDILSAFLRKALERVTEKNYSFDYVSCIINIITKEEIYFVSGNQHA